MSDLTAVSLFDGVGGFPEALRRTGVRTVATVEIDRVAAGVAADHFPEAQQFDDVTKVTGDDLRAAGFDPDRGLLTGGWPCQDLSLAGRRLGLDGARSGLFFEIVRLAADLRPRWLLLENVPGLLSAVCSCPGLGVCGVGCADPHPVRGGACGPGRCMELHGGAMGAVLGSLGELGYGLAYRVLDAQYFGVPQRRRRVVIVGCLGDWAAPAQVLLEPEGRGGDPTEGRSSGTVVAALTANGVGGGGGPDDNSAQVGHMIAYQGQGSNVGPMGTMRAGSGNVASGVPFIASALISRHGKGPESDLPDGHVVSVGVGQGHNTNYVAQPITAREGKGPDSDATSGNLITHALTAEGSDASEDGTGRETPLVGFDLAQITSSENRSNPRAGDPQPPLASTGQPHVAFGETGGDIATGVGVAPSVRTGTGGEQTGVVAAAVRRLTPVECERLQGYPDGWTATSNGRPQSDSARYRQLGNSIAVPVFEWAARRIAAYEHDHPATLDT